MDPLHNSGLCKYMYCVLNNQANIKKKKERLFNLCEEKYFRYVFDKRRLEAQKAVMKVSALMQQLWLFYVKNGERTQVSLLYRVCMKALFTAPSYLLELQWSMPTNTLYTIYRMPNGKDDGVRDKILDSRVS